VSFPLSTIESAILAHLREIDPRDILPRPAASTSGESPGTYRFAEAGGASDEPPVTRGGDGGGEWIDDE
jgi:hypothetical protein